jgi:hypothetical protein
MTGSIGDYLVPGPVEVPLWRAGQRFLILNEDKKILEPFEYGKKIIDIS